MGISFSITGNKVLSLKLEKAISKIKDMKPAFADMSPKIIDQYEQNYPAKGTLLQAPWQPRKYFYPWALLDKSGTMKTSYKGKPAAKSLTIDNTAPYAKYHQYGTSKLPIRKLLGIGESTRVIIRGSIMRYLMDGFR